MAFLGVFFNHSGFFFHYSEIGVSIFFVLSGALLYMRSDDDVESYTLKQRINYTRNKIKKIYPLHLITLILMFILAQIGIMGRKRRLIHCINAVLNVGLLQSWIPDLEINTSMNGVAWYLSTLAFLYFMFPAFYKAAKKLSIFKGIAIACLGIVIQLAVCVGVGSFTNFFSPVYLSLSYCCPIFRMLDLWTGCVVGKILVKNLDSKRDTSAFVTTKYTIIEVAILVTSVLVCSWNKNESSNAIIQAMHNWTTLYIPIAALWVIVFGICRGNITKLFANKLIVSLGNISSYTFLIHFVVIMYAERIISSCGMGLENINGINRFVLVALELTITIVLSIVYRIVENNKKRKV